METLGSERLDGGGHIFTIKCGGVAQDKIRIAA